MKRFVLGIVLLSLLLTLPCFAATATEQVLELQVKDHTLTLTATKPVAFFEKPQLQPGETVTVDGTLILKNATNTSREFTFTEVVFPYEDPAALEYLNHLQLEVLCEGTPLYVGPYSGINETAVREAFACTLSANETITYTLRLRCDYTYNGTTGLGDAVLDWRFDTAVLPSDLPPVEKTEPFTDPMIWQWVIGGGIAVVIIVGLIFAAKKIKL